MTTNPLFSGSVLSEILANEKATRVIGEPSDLQFLFGFLLGSSTISCPVYFAEAGHCLARIQLILQSGI